MPSKPRDHLSQRRLVYELRIAIDSARNAHSAAAHKSAVKAVEDLVAANPYSVQSKYVVHNIGTTRREWLSPLVATSSRGIDAR